LDIGVLGYIGIVQHKEHSPEVWHIPPGTPCIYIYRGREREREGERYIVKLNLVCLFLSINTTL